MKELLEEFRKRCPGILGSLVLDRDGGLVEQELPSFLELDIVQFKGQLMDMYLAMEPVVQKSSKLRSSNKYDIILKFDSIIIYCRVLQAGFLIVLAEQDANIIKLRSLSNLTIRKLDSLLHKQKEATNV